MTHSLPNRSSEQIIDTMIDLTRLSKSQRVIVAGTDAFDFYVTLHRHGFSNVATTTTSRFPCGQHDVAFIAGQHSIRTLQELLNRIAPFLKPRATVAVWIDVAERHGGKRLQTMLEQLGFRIEAGANCESGFILSAHRHEWSGMAKAA
jgi:hypothetical protein